VLFLLPWERHVIVGTTDEPIEIVDKPVAPEEDVAYLLDYVRRYFNTDVSEKDVKAAWCGIRPLVFDPKAKDTSQLAREHVIFESNSGLITIAGGKWTIYRLMAEHTVDRAVSVGKLNPLRGCVTHDMRLVGGCSIAPDADKVLAQRAGLPLDVATSLISSYGDEAEKIVALIPEYGMERLAEGHPFLEVEVLHAMRAEMAVHAADVLIRRMTLALTDTEAALAAADRVVELMAAELGWDEARRAEEAADAKAHVAAGL